MRSAEPLAKYGGRFKQLKGSGVYGVMLVFFIF